MPDNQRTVDDVIAGRLQMTDGKSDTALSTAALAACRSGFEAQKAGRISVRASVRSAKAMADATAAGIAFSLAAAAARSKMEAWCRSDFDGDWNKLYVSKSAIERQFKRSCK